MELEQTGLDEAAVEKIYQAKKREKRNPINLLVSSKEMINEIVKDISPVEEKLMNTFFPGAFTIILKKKEIVPNVVTANSNFVGIRMPKGEIAKELVELAGVPIAAPSANISGRLSGTRIEDIKEEFKENVEYMVDGGESEIGIESTVVKVENEVVHILRPGAITEEQIKKVVSQVEKDYQTNTSILPSKEIAHYKPKTKCIFLPYKKQDERIQEMKAKALQYQNPYILTFTEDQKFYQEFENVMAMGQEKKLEEVAKKLFQTIRKADRANAEIILIQGVEEKGVGIAIMDRLKKACN